MKKKFLSALLAMAMVLTLLPATALAWHADSDVAYAVTGGDIYFDPATGTITDAQSEVTKVDIPAQINGVAVTSIGSMAFYHCNSLTSVTIPDSVTSIENEAFENCSSLTSVTIPSSVTSIGAYAFTECTSLTSVTIPSSITSLEEGVFDGCSSLTSVTIPDSVTRIGDWAFGQCESLTSVTIPSSITSLEESVFARCSNLASVIIPASVTSIASTFNGSDNLTDVYYGGSEAQWKAIRFLQFDDGVWDYVPTTDLADVGLGKATIHYNSTGAEVQPPVAGFTDVKAGDWYAEAVQFAVDNGLMNGTGNGKFSPNGTTTRGQLMTILARLDGQDTSGGSVWYEKGMDWAKAKGISDGTNPTGVITREQLAAMLYRYAGSPAVSASLGNYPDAGKVSSYATDAMAWAVEQGIINGVSGNLAPQGTATRAQASTMIMRFYEKK